MRRNRLVLLLLIISFLVISPVHAEFEYPVNDSANSTFTVTIVSPDELLPDDYNETAVHVVSDTNSMIIFENPFLYGINNNDSGNLSIVTVYSDNYPRSAEDTSPLNTISYDLWYSDEMDAFLFFLIISLIVSGILSIVPAKQKANSAGKPEPFERNLIAAGHFAIFVLLSLITAHMISTSYNMFAYYENGLFVYLGLIASLVYTGASSLMLSIIIIKNGRRGYTGQVHCIVLLISFLFYFECIISGNPGLFGMNVIFIPTLLLLSLVLMAVSRLWSSGTPPAENKTPENEKTFYYNGEDRDRQYISLFPRELYEKYGNISIAGTGGAAIVFRAKRESDGEIVALKIPISRDEVAGKSFIREISVWKTLKHENIVEIYSANIFPSPYIEMEYLDRNLMSLAFPLPVEKTISIITGIAEGLEYAHAMGIVHHDIKPNNILLDDRDTPKITDWGLSKTIADNFESSNIGFSLVYAAPEQLFPSRFGKPGTRTDIYQTGVLFYELLTGEKPFKGDLIEEMLSGGDKGSIVPVSEILGDPSYTDLDRIIMRCLRRDPEQRYPDIESFLKDLKEISGNL
ncbi:serine/threonine protein kinase [Methanolacinia paynteri]|uniref:serine/threonine protein kinase n=1 Tax=Methanolacinia paynteri TaxID=230356 RepID=UPI0012F691DC|nr:serine/threonine-protein kinase [Methanolacinia paynteri]